MFRLLRRFATIPPSESKLTNSIIKAQRIFNEGIELWNTDDLVGAQKSFERSIAILPTSDSYYNLANVFHSLGKKHKAMENWQKSLTLKSRADCHLNIANMMALSEKDFKGSYQHYRAALDLEPNDGEIHYNLGIVLDQDGELEKAIIEYSAAVSLGIEQAEGTLRNARARWAIQQQKKLEQ